MIEFTLTFPSKAKLLLAFAPYLPNEGLVEQLEPARDLLLENTLRIVLLADSLQSRLLRSTVTADGILPRRCIVEVKILVVQAELLRLVFALLEEVFRVLLDARIISDGVPRYCQEQVEEVAVACAQTERIASPRRSFGRDCRGHGLEAETVG